MTTQNLIRILSGLMFLIFFCPFFQTCADENLDLSFASDVASSKPEGHITYEEVVDRLRDKATANGYQLSVYTFKIFKEDFNIAHFKVPAFYPYLCFSSTLILLIISFLFTLAAKFRTVGLLFNIIVLLNIIALVIAFVEEIIKDINQIKYGYYFFAVNLVIIIVLCAKLRNKTLKNGI